MVMKSLALVIFLGVSGGLLGSQARSDTGAALTPLDQDRLIANLKISAPAEAFKRWVGPPGSQTRSKFVTGLSKLAHVEVLALSAHPLNAPSVPEAIPALLRLIRPAEPAVYENTSNGLFPDDLVSPEVPAEYGPASAEEILQRIVLGEPLELLASHEDSHDYQDLRSCEVCEIRYSAYLVGKEATAQSFDLKGAFNVSLVKAAHFDLNHRDLAYDVPDAQWVSIRGTLSMLADFWTREKFRAHLSGMIKDKASLAEVIKAQEALIKAPPPKKLSESQMRELGPGRVKTLLSLIEQKQLSASKWAEELK